MTRAEQLDLFDGRRRKRQPAAPRATEHQEQVALMQWARLAAGKHPELALLYHVANGGWRHKAVAAGLKAAGVRPGVPDLDLPVARGPWHGLRIELKARGGKLSEPQVWWISALREQGYRAEVCHGWMAARDLIIDYLETRA
jgi:hypothetical protein